MRRTQVLATAVAVALTGCDIGIGIPPTAATHIGFRTQPVAVGSTARIGLVRVALLTEDELVAAAASGTITLSLVAADTSAQLTGTTTVATELGIAEYFDLSIAKAGTAYRLKATAAGFADVLSDPFNISVGPAPQLLINIAP